MSGQIVPVVKKNQEFLKRAHCTLHTDVHERADVDGVLFLTSDEKKKSHPS